MDGQTPTEEQRLAMVFRLTTFEASFMRALLDSELVTQSAIIDAQVQSLRMRIMRFRKKLRVHKITLHSKWQVGYWFTAADKENVRSAQEQTFVTT